MDKPINTQKKVPAIRFQGFSGEWEEKTLGNITDIYDGTHQTPKYTTDGIMFLSVENIKTLKSNKYISIECFKKDFKQYPQKNDVLMTRIGDIGTANVVEDNTPKAYYVTLALLKYKNLNPYFLKNSLSSKSAKKEIWNRTLHIAFPKKINLGEIVKVLINTPQSIKEQTQIGDFFQALDDLIAKREQKCAKLRKIKQALLGKLFPQAGETVPQMRFIDFSGDWEEKALGEVADIVGGGTPSTFISEYWNGDINWYSPTEIGDSRFVIKSKKKITELGLQKSSAKILPAHKTILFTSRASIGDMAVLKADACTNQGFQSLVTNDGHYPYFLYSYGFLIKKYALTNASGSTFLEISGKQLGKMPIKLPTHQEQTQIGNFFQRLDTLINQYEQQITTLKNIKQGYLNKMFI